MIRFIQTVSVLTVMLFGYSVITDNDFVLWKSDFMQFAEQQGITPKILEAAFTGLQPDHKVIKLDAHQPEFTRPIWEYLENTVSPTRIATGQQRLQEYADVLAQIETKYAVSRAYLVAIWGMESNYGQHTGHYEVIRSLATLAYAGREERREFWRKELLAALRILQQGDIAMVDMRGSWAGAIGHTQFIPSTFADYAVDFDGDGKRDVKNSIADALASAANYLVQSGWASGQPWGEEVSLPADFDWHLADPDIKKTAIRWMREHQVFQPNGLPLSGGNVPGFIFIPAGYRGPAFIAYPNFSVLLRYNNANSYALSVGHLADRLQGEGAVVAKWPRDGVVLSHAQKIELQALLSAVGYSTEGVDGKIGPNTQSALRAWQGDVGFPPDGYATMEHLELLRGQAKLQAESWVQE